MHERFTILQSADTSKQSEILLSSQKKSNSHAAARKQFPFETALLVSYVNFLSPLMSELLNVETRNENSRSENKTETATAGSRKANDVNAERRCKAF